MRSVTTMGDLTVVFDTTDQAAVDRQLKQLDDRLFLDPERDHTNGSVFWTVKQWVGSGVRPVHVIDWRERDGTPRPLNSGLVYEVEKRKRHFGHDIAAEAVQENDEARRKAWAEMVAEIREVGMDFHRHRHTGFSMVPRSSQLARTRARMRAEGKT